MVLTTAIYSVKLFKGSIYCRKEESFVDSLVICIEKVLYNNESSGYTVLACSTDDAVPNDITKTKYPHKLKNAITCILIDVSDFAKTFQKKIKYKVDGSWKKGKYGPQFEVKNIQPHISNTETEIIEYLITLNGVGVKTANAIYKTFKDETLTILSKYPEKLIEVRGISPKKIEKIKDSLEESLRFKTIVDYFSKFSLSASKIKKIYEEFGENAINVVEENPFFICSVEGINFLDANSIAIDNKVGLKSNQRLSAGIKFVIQTLTAHSGDLFTLSDEIISKTKSLLNKDVSDEVKISDNELLLAYNSLVSDGSIVSMLSKKGNKYTYDFGSFVCEREVSKKIVDMLFNPSVRKIEEVIVKSNIESLEKRYKIKLATKQKQAVITSLNNNISIITGGPGTGKTTVMRFVLDIFREHFSDKIMLCAPTGRAARRMAESTGFLGASTIHSALGIQNDYSWAQSMGSIPTLDTDLIIIDEASMIDMELLYVLMNSINYSTKVVFIGDAEQLPSVGPGNCLREMIKSDIVPVTKLDVIYRQKNESKIIINSDKLNKQDFDFKFDETFMFCEENNNELITKKIVDRFFDEIKKPNRSLDNVQILTPFKTDKVSCSTFEFNNIIQERINPLKNKYDLFMKVGKYTFRKGDKVIQQKNNDIAKNGDIGYITNIDVVDKDLIAVIEFVDGETANYTRGEMEENMIALAYAITVHKSQGSEYATVLMPIIPSHKFMLNKNLIYTAWTRAKENVFLIGNKNTLIECGKISNIDSRKTILSIRMQQRLEAYKKHSNKKRKIS